MPPKKMPPFDSRLGMDDTQPKNELDSLVRAIRQTSERIAWETWEEYYDRTYLLALAQLRRRTRLT